jgi:hypothetical protein
MPKPPAISTAPSGTSAAASAAVICGMVFMLRLLNDMIDCNRWHRLLQVAIGSAPYLQLL